MTDDTLVDLSSFSARDRILRTAHELFYREGIRATGVDRVIANAGVTKVTFYRHFPSKNDLILAFLEHRHQCWMRWFGSALERRRGEGDDFVAALPAVLREWLADDRFRGCAFINAVAEIGNVLPQATDAARRHKQDVLALITAQLPASEQREETAKAIALAMDGAIVRAQMDGQAEPALSVFGRLLTTLVA